MRHTRHIALRILLALFLVCLLASPAAAKKEKKLPDWLGTYCSETACLKIYNLREGPMGFYLMFEFLSPSGETLGDAIAPLYDNVNKAGYAILDFTLSKDGKQVVVSRIPDAVPPAEDSPWIEKVFGTYVAKEK